jgi:hypothetical protein
MANRKQPFRQHLAARGLRAALAAGVPNPSVEFHTPDGGKIVVGSAGGRPAVAAPPRPAVASKPRPPAPPRGIRPSR